MANVEKIIQKMLDKPYRSDITKSELHKVLIYYGFYLARDDGSHTHYKHKNINTLITIPAHGDSKNVLPVYVKKVVDIVTFFDL